jgi:hypothetical protein
LPGGLFNPQSGCGVAHVLGSSVRSTCSPAQRGARPDIARGRQLHNETAEIRARSSGVAACCSDADRCLRKPRPDVVCANRHQSGGRAPRVAGAQQLAEKPAGVNRRVRERGPEPAPPLSLSLQPPCTPGDPLPVALSGRSAPALACYARCQLESWDSQSLVARVKAGAEVHASPRLAFMVRPYL